MEADAQRRAQALDALRNRVLHVVGHALRSPVCTARGLAHAIDGASDAEVRAVIAPSLVRALDGLSALVDDLLVASEVTTALPTGGRVPRSVAATAREAWAARRLGGELQIEGDCDACAHDGALERILGHLLTNAAFYCGRPVRVVACADHGVARVVVEAPGPEPTDSELEHAFEPFYRSEMAVMSSPGLGLGLTVARALAEHAGGELCLERVPGYGARATLTLPHS